MKPADFAQSLVHKLAVPLLADGYRQLVESLRANGALEQLIAESGIDAALASDSQAMSIFKKGNKELVTSFEKEAEAAMREAVAARYPAHAIVGEEHGYTPGSETRWVFDPIDGTSAMIRWAISEAFGLSMPSPAPSFGITVAMVEGDEAVLGIVTELKPAADSLFPIVTWVGGKNQPTLCNGEKITAPKAPGNLIECGLSSTAPEVMFKTREQWGGFQALRDNCHNLATGLNCVGFMATAREGSGIHVAYEADLAYHDAAALVPILQGAGITVTGDNGEKLSFPESRIGQEYRVLAATPVLHALALAAIKAGVPEEKNGFHSLGNNAKDGYAPKFAPTSAAP